MADTGRKMTWEELAAENFRLHAERSNILGSMGQLFQDDSDWVDKVREGEDTEEFDSRVISRLNSLAKLLQAEDGYMVQQHRVIEGFNELFPNEGWKIIHPELGEMPEEFADSVLNRVGRLKAQHKLAEEQATTWKKRLNDETERLREIIKADRDALGQALCELWPNEFNVQMMYAAEVPVVKRAIQKLSELHGFLRSGQPDLMAVLEELERERLAMGVIVQAAEGNLAAAHTPEFNQDYPGYSDAAQLVIDLRASAATAIFLANQRNTRAQKFMSPAHFARVHYSAYRDAYAKSYPLAATLPLWEELEEGPQQELIDLAKVIFDFHQAAMDGNGTEDDPVVVELLEKGDALTKAVALLEEMRQDRAYQHLEHLDEFLRERFPRQVVAGDDGPLDAVRRAQEILDVFATHGPTMIKFMWENGVRPAIHLLQRYGIDVLPPGTIIYGAKPNTNVHRPE